MNFLKTRVQSPGGVTASEVEPLAAAIATAKSKGVAEDVKELVDSVEFHERMKKTLECQTALQSALDSNDLKELKAAMQSLGYESKNDTIFTMLAELDKDSYVYIMYKLNSRS